MVQTDYTLIGIDGGATKVSGRVVKYIPEDAEYDLSEIHSELPYNSIDNYIANFIPVDIQTQLSQREKGKIIPSKEESIQGEAFIEACAQVIQELYDLTAKKPLLIGIGMPGLKTGDQRGIDAIANGPRMPHYCSLLEQKLNLRNIPLKSPIARLGSDADYCGIGEFYAVEGSFRDVNNAYYLGGGTGAADALLLKGKLIPFDQIKSWMAKTWEMKNDLDLSFERYASASGLQNIYSRHSGKTIESLNSSGIFPPQIAEAALIGEQAAINSFKEVAEYLAVLIFERIVTLFCGSSGLISFINPNRGPLDPHHNYRNQVFDRIIFGQRLGDLMASQTGKKVLTEPFLNRLFLLLSQTDYMTEETRNHYLKKNGIDLDRIVFSNLREAPALGAGIDAHLAHCS